jgi:DNA-directed RNA polymerase subunit RPC12/RpoP
MHPRAIEFLFEMQSEKITCIYCGFDRITKGTHLDNNNGLSVFMKYTCQMCKKEFLDKEIPQALDTEDE